jgi:hypothetical protein
MIGGRSTARADCAGRLPFGRIRRVLQSSGVDERIH